MERFENGFYVLEEGKEKRPLHGFRMPSSTSEDARWYNSQDVCVFSRLYFHPDSMRTLLAELFSKVIPFFIQLFPGSDALVYYLTLSTSLPDPCFMQGWFLGLYQFFPPFRALFREHVDEAIQLLSFPFLHERLILLLKNPPRFQDEALVEEHQRWVRETLDPLVFRRHSVLLVNQPQNAFEIFFQKEMVDFGQTEGLEMLSWPSWNEWNALHFPDGKSTIQKLKDLSPSPEVVDNKSQ